MARRKFQQGYGQHCKNARSDQGRWLALCRYETSAQPSSSERIQASVLKLLADYRDAQVRDRDPSNGDVAAAELIFVNSSGNPLNERNLVQRNFQVILERAKLPRIRLYDLRHTAATLALGAGVPAKVVSEQLGHASVAFTLDTYSHVLPHMQEAAAAQVEALLFEPAPKERSARNKKRAITDKTKRAQK
jgi:integrase